MRDGSVENLGTSMTNISDADWSKEHYFVCPDERCGHKWFTDDPLDYNCPKCGLERCAPSWHPRQFDEAMKLYYQARKAGEKLDMIYECDYCGGEFNESEVVPVVDEHLPGEVFCSPECVVKRLWNLGEMLR